MHTHVLQIDLRFGNEDQGSLEIVVAPIARFLDVPEGANIKIEQIGKPDKIISGFHPEIYGKPLQVLLFPPSQAIGCSLVGSGFMPASPPQRGYLHACMHLYLDCMYCCLSCCPGSVQPLQL